jgi:hypothetical protein
LESEWCCNFLCLRIEESAETATCRLALLLAEKNVLRSSDCLALKNGGCFPRSRLSMVTADMDNLIGVKIKV